MAQQVRHAFLALFMVVLFLPQSVSALGTATNAPGHDSSKANTASMTLTPSQGLPGQQVVAGGAGYASGEVVTISWIGSSTSYQQLGTVNADTQGSWVFTFTVPSNALSGRVYYVLAVGATSKIRLAKPFKVLVPTPTPTLTSTPTPTFTPCPTVVNATPLQGRPGTVVTVTGRCFTPRQIAYVSFNGKIVAAAIVGSAGTFTTRFIVPRVNCGDYPVAVKVGTNETDFTFSVTCPPPTATPTITPVPCHLTFAISPASGEVGDTVNFSGTCARSNAMGTVYFDQMLVTTVTVAADGTFAGSFTVPSTRCGKHYVIIRFLISSVGAYAVFTIPCPPTATPTDTSVATNTPPPTNTPTATSTPCRLTFVISPASGEVGDTVNVSGGCAPANATGAIYFDQMLVTTVTVAADGAFAGSFTVPNVRCGLHYVIARFDTSGIGAYALFTIPCPPTATATNTALPTNTATPTNSPTATNTPCHLTVSVTPTSGQPGDTVNVSGSCAYANAVGAIYFDQTRVTTFTVGADGAFSTSFVVPNVHCGQHYVIVAFAAGTFGAYVPFTIPCPPTATPTDTGTATNTALPTSTPTATNTPCHLTVAITPTSGHPGDTVNVSGGCAPANAMGGVYFDQMLVTTVTVTADGAFAGSFTVPNVYCGPHYVIVRFTTSGIGACALFTIPCPPTATPTNTYTPRPTNTPPPTSTPPCSGAVTVTPTTGRPGDSIGISGTGTCFNADMKGYVVFGSSLVMTFTVTTSGSFTTTFTVPTVPCGTYRLYVLFSPSTSNTGYGFSFNVPCAPAIAPSAGDMAAHWMRHVV